MINHPKMIDETYGFDAGGTYVIDQYWTLGEDILFVSVRFKSDDEYMNHAMATIIDGENGKQSDVTFCAPLSTWMRAAESDAPTRDHPDPTPAFRAVVNTLVARAHAVADVLTDSYR